MAFKRYICWAALVLAIEIAALVMVMLLNPPKTRADITVEVPGPGTCPYPGVSDQGMVGTLVATWWWSCDFPVEENGSILHSYYYGAATQGNAQVGFSMMFSVSAGVAGPVGAMKGGTHYVCPDGPNKGKRTAWPNPPGAWKYALTPRVCVPLKDQPIADDPWPNVPPPTPPDAMPVPPPETLTPAVTNPDNPNPGATVNPNPSVSQPN
jgi:hypothetical protein